MPLHINAKYVLLTYAQCGTLEGDAVVERISSLGGECVVARESHADGGIHLHVFVRFGRKFRSRKADVFDVDGRHPNIVPSRGTPEKGYDYATKGGDIVCGGLRRGDCLSGSRDGSSRDLWAQITGAEDREQFWELCHELDPKSAATAFCQLRAYSDWKFTLADPIYESPANYTFRSGQFDGRDDWLLQSGIGSEEPLIGERSPPSRYHHRVATYASLRGTRLA